MYFIKTQPLFIPWLLSIVISRLFYQSAHQLELGPYLGSGFCFRQIFIFPQMAINISLRKIKEQQRLPTMSEAI